MTVTLKSDVAHRQVSGRKRSSKARVTSLRIVTVQPSPCPSVPNFPLRVVVQNPHPEQGVCKLPEKPADPLWLRLLVVAYQGSMLLTGGLVASVLLVYGWMVGANQLTLQAVHRLESLQRSKQQLIAANEVLKSHMAQQAENSGTGLHPPQPASAIFIQPASERPATNPQRAAESGLASPKDVSKLLLPLGY